MRELPTVDQMLLSLESQVLRLESEANAAKDDRTIEALGAKICGLEQEISATLAHSPAGVAVKVRRLWAGILCDGDPVKARNLRTTIESLDHLQSGWGGNLARSD